MKPSVSIFGLGYVGSVTAACLAHEGFDVIGVDVNPAKVEALNSGQSPVVEAIATRSGVEKHRAPWVPRRLWQRRRSSRPAASL